MPCLLKTTIDKIGDCYSYHIILISILDLVKSFGNATNNTHQMDLVNITLIINSIFLISFMYLFAKWDICGIIIANGISSIFLINCNLYIIFCGKLNNIISDNKFSIISDIKNYLEKCFLSKKTIILTTLLVIFGYFFKNSLNTASFCFSIISCTPLIVTYFIFIKTG